MFASFKKCTNIIPFLSVSLIVIPLNSFSADYPVVQMVQSHSKIMDIKGKNNKKSNNNQKLNKGSCLSSKEKSKSIKDVYLKRCDDKNDNQHWYEIERGGGYYSYQKLGTNLCLGGKHKGKHRKKVYVNKCADDNSQHWLKVDLGKGNFRLENRITDDFSIDANQHNSHKEKLRLSTSNNSSQSQYWSFNYIRSAGATFVGGGGTVAGALPVSCKISDDFTVVHSLPAMITAMKSSAVKVALAPGNYQIDESGRVLFTNLVLPGDKDASVLFSVNGSKSHYDFRCANIKFDTDLWREFNSNQIIQLRTVGNDNIISNLTIEDIGDTAPKGKALGVMMDGRDNIIEGAILSSRGSQPYGLGDAFGKGRGSVLDHQKHSSVLIRGLRNTFKQSTVFNYAYGHSVFMQGSEDTLIDGIYVQGELRSTADMLAANNPRFALADARAASIDFTTVWGYKLPTGYWMSLQEAGIRAYNSGRTIIDGVEYGRRPANHVTVLNSVIRNTRTGVTLAHAIGKKHVENTTVLGCETGYSIGSGNIVGSYANADIGPVLSFAYSTDNGTTADITVLPTDGNKNAWGAVAFIGGKNHNITLRSDENTVNQNLKVVVSGDKNSIRHLKDSLQNQDQLTLINSKVNNFTPYPVLINELAENVTGQSDGPISGNESENSHIKQN